MWAGAYALDLYCDNEDPDRKGALTDKFGHMYNEFPHQFSAETGAECRKAARKKGWIIKSDGTAICPKCSGKKTPSNAELKRGATTPTKTSDA